MKVNHPIPVTARNVIKKFGDFVSVNEISLEVRPGECFGLLGPNGAGKSTFINMLYGVVRRTSGELAVYGMDPVLYGREIKKVLGVVTQVNALDQSLTVEENMRLYASFYGVPSKERSFRVKQLLEYMSLDHKKASKIQTLSGGMQRRLVFVRALLSQPKFLILDEPTTGLDPAVRHLLWDKVSDLKSKGTTVLLTTHYMHEAEILCDRVAIINKGKIVDVDSPRKLIEKYAPGFVSVYRKEHEVRLSAWIDKTKSESIRQTQDSTWLYLRAHRLDDLVSLTKGTEIEPSLMRPANLEDVFLKVTGQELTYDA